MDPVLPADCFINGSAVGRVGKKVAVGNGLVDAGKALINHSARAKGHMAHFAVSHLPFGQAHSQSRRGNKCCRAMVPEVVHNRGFGCLYSIGFFAVAVAIAVKHQQNQRFFLLAHDFSQGFSSKFE